MSTLPSKSLNPKVKLKSCAKFFNFSWGYISLERTLQNWKPTRDQFLSSVFAGLPCLEWQGHISWWIATTCTNGSRPQTIKKSCFFRYSRRYEHMVLKKNICHIIKAQMNSWPNRILNLLECLSLLGVWVTSLFKKKTFVVFGGKSVTSPLHRSQNCKGNFQPGKTNPHHKTRPNTCPPKNLSFVSTLKLKPTFSLVNPFGCRNASEIQLSGKPPPNGGNCRPGYPDLIKFINLGKLGANSYNVTFLVA